ncbi:MAG: hypothetical protein HYV34_01085 [Candidatus Kerfeldbacteria bacterium]|nr:hypothetical protein [Candidatus Kerfeldbacteria bacterium]
MTNFDTQYQQAIRTIVEEGVDVPNPWSGRTVRSVPGMTLRLDLEKGFPVLTLRKIPIQLFVAEQIWFLMGAHEPSWLQQFTPIWDEFVEEDGTIAAAYGYRWRHHFGRDQIDLMLKDLAANPMSRHGVIITWDPAGDGLGPDMKKNLPCPYTFTVNIIGGRLNLHNIIRSNDMMLGCPHDTAGFALLAMIFAQKLGVRPGVYTQSISHAHVYDNHLPQAEELITRTNAHPELQLVLPENSYERAVAGDVELVREITERITSHYYPDPAIKGMKITVNMY